MPRFLKTAYATAQVTAHCAPQGSAEKIAQVQNFRGFEFTPRDGYLYVAVRAVSARVNRNYDAFSAQELKRAYKSFEGRPVFINHENTDVRRARGVIIASKLRDENPRDVHVEVLMELDKITYPKFCHYVETGELDTWSMGCNIAYSKCSVCGNEAHTPNQYCQHIANKGIPYEVKTASGGIRRILAYEDCYGVDFFEESGVFDPADRSAMTVALLAENAHTASAIEANRKVARVQVINPPAIAKVAQMRQHKPSGSPSVDNGGSGSSTTRTEIRRPEVVDTLRAESICPECGNENFDGSVCDVCGYLATPETFKNPDVSLAKEIQLPVETIEPKSVKSSGEKTLDPDDPFASDKQEAPKEETPFDKNEEPFPKKDESEEDPDDPFADKGEEESKDSKAESEDSESKDESRDKEKSEDDEADKPKDEDKPEAEDKSDKDEDEDDFKNRKGGREMRPSISEMRRIAAARRAQVGETPEAAPASTAVDVNADRRIDVTAPGGTDVPAEVTAPAATTDHLTNPTDGVQVVQTEADTTTDVLARRRLRAQTEGEGPTPANESTAPTGDATVETAPVNQVDLPPASDTADLTNEQTAPVFPEETTGGGGEEAVDTGQIQPLPSVTTQDTVVAQRVSFVKAYKLAELRVEAGLEAPSVDKTVLADRLSSKHTVGELDVAISTLAEIKRVAAARAAARGMVPRRQASVAPQRRSVPFVGSKKASANNVPDEALFGLM